MRKPEIKSKNLPAWARPGRFRFARLDGGPIEVSKAVLSGWSYMTHPDSIYACSNIYNDETIKLLKQSYINWIWVTWSVGFSLKTEQRQRQILTPFITKCKKNGIRVSAYLSLTNMFWEDMFREEPQSEGWGQVDEDGRTIPYGCAFYVGEPTRYLACLNIESWKDYIKKRVDLALDAGVDGLVCDNLFYSCHCDRCQEIFRKYVKKHLSIEHSIPKTKEVKVSKEAASQGREGEILTTETSIDSELQLIWVKFQHEILAKTVKEIREHASRRKPDIIVYCNAHQQKILNDVCNAIITEDAKEPTIFEGKLITNIDFLKTLSLQTEGWKPVIIEYGIRKDRFTPMSAEKYKLSIAESAAFQAGQSITPEGWFLNGLYYRYEEALATWEAISEYNKFLKGQERYYADVNPTHGVSLIDAPEYVVANPVEQQDKIIIHLLNYSSQLVRNIKIKIDNKDVTARNAVLLSPDNLNKAMLSVKQREGKFEIMVPELIIYNLIIIER